MIDKISVEIIIKCEKNSILKALHDSTNLENKLAPKNIKIKQLIKQHELVFKLEKNNFSEGRGRIDSLRRTIDDYIFSLNLAYQSLIKAIRYGEDEILRNNGKGPRGHCCGGSESTF